jgi:hypothetical protein
LFYEIPFEKISQEKLFTRVDKSRDNEQDTGTISREDLTFSNLSELKTLRDQTLDKTILGKK